MKRPCYWCDRDYVVRSRSQRCCSWSCAQSLRQAEARRTRVSQPAKPVGWRLRPSSSEGRGWAHAKLRQQLLPQAYGRACPMCRRVMLAGQKLALDHIVPIARGGQTVIGNVRIVHAGCNAAAGSRLGNQSLRRRRGY